MAQPDHPGGSIGWLGASFWEHLEVLRGVLIRLGVYMAVAFMAAFWAVPYLFEVLILAPCRADFVLYSWLCDLQHRLPVLPDFCRESFSVDIVNIRMVAPFMYHIQTAFWLELIALFPLLLWEVWRFVRSGLYPTERRYTRTAFALGVFFFYTGVAVGYLLVFPMTLRFLVGYQLSELIPNQLSLDSYMGNFFVMLLLMGLLFELPVLSWLLSQVGLLRRRHLKQYRRHVVVLLLVLSALITPSGDPFTLMVVFVPLYALYEASALLVRQ